RVVEMLPVLGPGEGQPVLHAEILIELRSVGVLDSLLRFRSGRDIVANQPGGIRRRVILRYIPGQRAQPILRNGVRWERIAEEPALSITPGGGWIVDRNQSAVRQLPVLEIALNHLWQWNGLLGSIGGLWKPVAFVGEE